MSLTGVKEMQAWVNQRVVLVSGISRKQKLS
jgi:hypothetical protein